MARESVPWRQATDHTVTGPQVNSFQSSRTGTTLAVFTSSAIMFGDRHRSKIRLADALRMGGRVDEGGSLENCCTLAGTLGSNPSPSAYQNCRESPFPSLRGFWDFARSLTHPDAPLPACRDAAPIRVDRPSRHERRTRDTRRGGL